MRIAHVVPTYPPYRGGVGRLAQEYAIRLRARGHDARVLTPRHQHAHGDEDFVQRLPSLLRIGNAALMPSLVSRLRDFDLVHLHYPFFGGAEPVLLRAWLHREQPLVVSYHMDAVADGVKGAIFRSHARLVLPRIVQRANRVLVSSNDYAARSALASIPGCLGRVEEHPYGVDTERFRPGSEPALQQRLSIMPEVFSMIFVAGLDPAHHFKGLEILLQALAGVPSDRWRLVVVGDGSLRRGFEIEASKLGISSRVVFLGDVSDPELPSFYRAVQMHVCPSTAAAEAFSLVSLEAGSSGIPTLASALPGVRTVVIHGKTGALVPAGDRASLRDAIQSLMDQPGRLLEWGQAARARAEAHFRWEPAIDRLEATCRDVLRAGSARTV
jgi:glycosyltransferase involved in cell wall biosynthesis